MIPTPEINNIREKYLTTVTVGIPAHNEAHNIENVLDSVCSQRQSSYVIERIVVLCDGCTDGTDKKALAFAKNNPRVLVVNDEKRSGKASRLNKLFSENTSDIVVICDADTRLADEDVFEKLLCYFQDPAVGLVGGNDTPLPPETFFEKIAVVHAQLWYAVRKDVNDGDSPHNAHGALVALRRAFAKKLTIPTHAFADDTYMYFRAAELGFKFRFARDAVTYYRSARSLRDYYAQSLRHLGGKTEITKEFGQWVERYRRIPRRHKLRAIVRAWQRDPFFVSCAVVVDFVMKIVRRIRANGNQGKYWQQVQSTKQLLP